MIPEHDDLPRTSREGLIAEVIRLRDATKALTGELNRVIAERDEAKALASVHCSSCDGLEMHGPGCTREIGGVA